MARTTLPRLASSVLDNSSSLRVQVLQATLSLALAKVSSYAASAGAGAGGNPPQTHRADSRNPMEAAAMPTSMMPNAAGLGRRVLHVRACSRLLHTLNHPSLDIQCGTTNTDN